MAIDATANQPTTTTSSAPNASVKVATPDLFVFKDEVVPIEVMTDLIFENIGGQELINISRNDIVSGQSIVYSPIKNMSSLYLQYNPQNILNLQDTSATYFKNYPIKFEASLPSTGSGPSGETVYIDPDTGDLIIDIVNLDADEQVDIQILVSGTLLDGTIYTGGIQ
jgi:hypothetical protein